MPAWRFNVPVGCVSARDQGNTTLVGVCGISTEDVKTLRVSGVDFISFSVGDPGLCEDAQVNVAIVEGSAGKVQSVVASVPNIISGNVDPRWLFLWSRRLCCTMHKARPLIVQ